jgi:hypothetical protein
MTDTEENSAWNDELGDPHDWQSFGWSIERLQRRLSLSVGAAESRLRKLCADGIVRALRVRYDDEDSTTVTEPPEIIKPSDWVRDQIDLTLDEMLNEDIWVSQDDLLHWLEQQAPAEHRTTGPSHHQDVGKQPLIISHLRQLYPDGVPDPAHCPRKILRADLIKLDKTLGALDEATLKKAIDKYNSGIRNDPN